MSRFKVGDKVRVVKPLNDNRWLDHFDIMLGREATVVGPMTSFGVDGWWGLDIGNIIGAYAHEDWITLAWPSAAKKQDRNGYCPICGNPAYISAREAYCDTRGCQNEEKS